MGYCYVVSEALHHYVSAGRTIPFTFRVNGESHWFLKNGERLIDFTASQFDEELDYSTAMRGPFFKGGVETPVGFISKRGRAVAVALGLV